MYQFTHSRQQKPLLKCIDALPLFPWAERSRQTRKPPSAFFRAACVAIALIFSFYAHADQNPEFVPTWQDAKEWGKSRTGDALKKQRDCTTADVNTCDHLKNAPHTKNEADARNSAEAQAYKGDGKVTDIEAAAAQKKTDCASSTDPNCDASLYMDTHKATDINDIDGQLNEAKPTDPHIQRGESVMSNTSGQLGTVGASYTNCTIKDVYETSWAPEACYEEYNLSAEERQCRDTLSVDVQWNPTCPPPPGGALGLPDLPTHVAGTRNPREYVCKKRDLVNGPYCYPADRNRMAQVRDWLQQGQGGVGDETWRGLHVCCGDSGLESFRMWNDIQRWGLTIFNGDDRPRDRDGNGTFDAKGKVFRQWVIDLDTRLAASATDTFDAPTNPVPVNASYPATITAPASCPSTSARSYTTPPDLDSDGNPLNYGFTYQDFDGVIASGPILNPATGRYACVENIQSYSCENAQLHDDGVTQTVCVLFGLSFNTTTSTWECGYCPIIGIVPANSALIPRTFEIDPIISCGPPPSGGSITGGPRLESGNWLCDEQYFIDVPYCPDTTAPITGPHFTEKVSEYPGDAGLVQGPDVWTDNCRKAIEESTYGTTGALFCEIDADGTVCHASGVRDINGLDVDRPCWDISHVIRCKGGIFASKTLQVDPFTLDVRCGPNPNWNNTCFTPPAPDVTGPHYGPVQGIGFVGGEVYYRPPFFYCGFKYATRQASSPCNPGDGDPIFNGSNNYYCDPPGFNVSNCLAGEPLVNTPCDPCPNPAFTGSDWRCEPANYNVGCTDVVNDGTYMATVTGTINTHRDWDDPLVGTYIDIQGAKCVNVRTTCMQAPGGHPSPYITRGEQPLFYKTFPTDVPRTLALFTANTNLGPYKWGVIDSCWQHMHDFECKEYSSNCGSFSCCPDIESGYTVLSPDESQCYTNLTYTGPSVASKRCVGPIAKLPSQGCMDPASPAPPQCCREPGTVQCVDEDENPVPVAADGTCFTFKHEYQCPVISSHTQVTDCKGEVFKRDDDNIPWETGHEPDQNFGVAATGMETARQSGRDAQGNCAVEAACTVFNGKKDSCKKKLFGLINCCSNAGKIISGMNDAALGIGSAVATVAIATALAASAIATFGIGLVVAAIVQFFIAPLFTCKDSDKLNAVKRNQKLCHYVGEHCSKKLIFGACVEREKVWCCFTSILSRIINEQGRAQIGKGWGDGKRPRCEGFSIAELQSLRFDQMDFTEFFQTLKAKQPDKGRIEAQQGVSGNCEVDKAICKKTCNGDLACESTCPKCQSDCMRDRGQCLDDCHTAAGVNAATGQPNPPDSACINACPHCRVECEEKAEQCMEDCPKALPASHTDQDRQVCKRRCVETHQPNRANCLYQCADDNCRQSCPAC